MHGRSLVAVAQLLATIEILADYLDEQGIEIPPEVLEHLGEEAEIGTASLTRRMARVLMASLEEQVQQQHGADPVLLFVETLGEALASGRAHVRGLEGQDAPAQYKALLGWRRVEVVSGGIQHSEWRAHGEHIGWVEGEYLYLNPPVAYATVSRLLAEQGTEMPKKPATLWGEMLAAGWIALTDRERKRRRATYKKRIGGMAKDTLVLRLAEIIEARGEPERDDVPFAA